MARTFFFITSYRLREHGRLSCEKGTASKREALSLEPGARPHAYPGSGTLNGLDLEADSCPSRALIRPRSQRKLDITQDRLFVVETRRRSDAAQEWRTLDLKTDGEWSDGVAAVERWWQKRHQSQTSDLRVGTAASS